MPPSDRPKPPPGTQSAGSIRKKNDDELPSMKDDPRAFADTIVPPKTAIAPAKPAPASAWAPTQVDRNAPPLAPVGERASTGSLDQTQVLSARPKPIDSSVLEAVTQISSGSEPTADEEDPTNLCGTILQEKYRIDSILGEGGMGRVYKGFHLGLGGEIAIKFLHRQWASTPELRTRFRLEAAALAKLRHPGIVSVLDFGETDGNLFMVLELVKGTALHLLVGKLSVPRLGVVFDQILQVLEAAHAANIVHRDIKPENVMLLDGVDRTDRIKVLDFGIALVQPVEGANRITEAGAVRGTPFYMSPEQCRGRNVGPPTDVYAVGIMLYEFFAGVPPFMGDSTADILAQHLYVDPPPLALTDQAVPAGINPLLRRVLSKKPEERPTAAEFRDELITVLRGTDAAAIAAKAAAERVRMANQSREARAITRRVENTPTSPSSAPTAPTVTVWTTDEQRWLRYRDLLSVNGLHPVRWADTSVPPITINDRTTSVVLLAHSDQPTEQTQLFRKDPAHSKLPILVVGVKGTDQVAMLIRAGANDVVLDTVPEEESCKKLWRLIRRGR